MRKVFVICILRAVFTGASVVCFYFMVFTGNRTACHVAGAHHRITRNKSSSGLCLCTEYPVWCQCYLVGDSDWMDSGRSDRISLLQENKKTVRNGTFSLSQFLYFLIIQQHMIKIQIIRIVILRCGNGGSWMLIRQTGQKIRDIVSPYRSIFNQL